MARNFLAFWKNSQTFSPSLPDGRNYKKSVEVGYKFQLNQVTEKQFSQCQDCIVFAAKHSKDCHNLPLNQNNFFLEVRFYGS
jgi:hypothetical protein